MARQKDQWELEFRIGPGEVDGRRGCRGHRQNVAPEVAEWFRDLRGDSAFPVDPRVGSFHVYINGELASSITAIDAPVRPSTGDAPTDLARVEQLRGEAGRLETRVATLTGQAAVDDRRLAGLQSELAILEAKLTAERERVGVVVAMCDDEIKRAREAAAAERTRIADDLTSFRAAMMKAREETAEMFEILRVAENEEMRTMQKRRVLGQTQLTAIVEEMGGLGDRVLQNAITSGNRPGLADQAQRLGITVPGVVAGASTLIDKIYERRNGGGG